MHKYTPYEQLWLISSLSKSGRQEVLLKVIVNLFYKIYIMKQNRDVFALYFKQFKMCKCELMVPPTLF